VIDVSNSLFRLDMSVKASVSLPRFFLQINSTSTGDTLCLLLPFLSNNIFLNLMASQTLLIGQGSSGVQRYALLGNLPKHSVKL
jgi:hypothetical protein